MRKKTQLDMFAGICFFFFFSCLGRYASACVCLIAVTTIVGCKFVAPSWNSRRASGLSPGREGRSRQAASGRVFPPKQWQPYPDSGKKSLWRTRKKTAGWIRGWKTLACCRPDGRGKSSLSRVRSRTGMVRIVWKINCTTSRFLKH